MLLAILLNSFSSIAFASTDENIIENNTIGNETVITNEETNNVTENNNTNEITNEEIQEEVNTENKITNEIDNKVDEDEIENIDNNQDIEKTEENTIEEVENDYEISLLATQDIPLQTISNNTSFDPEYGFSFKFIDGKTTTETSGMTNNSVDYNMNTSSTADLSKSDYYSAR